MKKTVMALGAAATLVFAACGSGGGSGSAAKFCDVAVDLEKQMDALDSVGDSEGPEAIKLAFTEAEDALKRAAKSAPAAIKDDMNTLLDGVSTFNSVGKKHDYDIMKMAEDPDLAKVMGDEKLNTASDNVQQYLETECGISGS